MYKQIPASIHQGPTQYGMSEVHSKYALLETPKRAPSRTLRAYREDTGQWVSVHHCQPYNDPWAQYVYSNVQEMTATIGTYDVYSSCTMPFGLLVPEYHIYHCAELNVMSIP